MSSNPYGPAESFPVPDFTGGAVVVYRDFFYDPEGDAYCQRVDGKGVTPLGWPGGGLRVGGRGFNDAPSNVVADSSRAVYAAIGIFFPPTGSDVHLQRILPQGELSPGWPADGLPIASSAADERHPRLCTDVEGGAYVAFESDTATSTRVEIYVQRITSAAMVAPGWAGYGQRVSSVNSFKALPSAAGDGAGGVIVVWVDGRGDPGGVLFHGDIYAQHLQPDGALAPGWQAGGNPLCTAPRLQSFMEACGDGAGGAYAVWSDYRNDPQEAIQSDVFMNHILGNGTLAPGWPTNGLAVCTAPNYQQFFDITPDGQGGALVCWDDFRPVNNGAYLQRVDSNGQIHAGWPANGLSVTSLGGSGPRLASDGLGGAYVTYVVGYNVYVQHVDGNGQIAAGFTGAGTPVADVPNPLQFNASICSDAQGGAIVVWTEQRGQGGSDYAQRFVPDGPVPVQFSLVATDVDPDRVRLQWLVSEASFPDGFVDRRTAESDWARVGNASIDGEGYVSFEDRAVEPGTRYAYRLVLGLGGSSSFSSEVWIDVPQAYRFALEGARPNPASGSNLNVAFTLSRGASAALEAFDLNGRRLESREVGSLGPGRHTLRLGDRERFAPGIYWLRLSQGRDIASTRVIVTQ